jgi:hypothetical protein
MSDKRTLSWHRQCLLNIMIYLKGKKEDLVRLQNEITQLEKREEFYRLQIDTAEAEGKDNFDETRFMQKHKKEMK